jgi:hypothetical protein
MAISTTGKVHHHQGIVVERYISGQKEYEKTDTVSVIDEEKGESAQNRVHIAL